jgi:hypothetical protein
MNMELRNMAESSIRIASLLVRFRCEISRKKVKTVVSGTK